MTYTTSRAGGQALVTMDALRDATVTTNWDAHLLKEGQHVWAFVRITRHPAIIVGICCPENKAFVKWTSTNRANKVDLDTLFPMFDCDKFGIVWLSIQQKRICTAFFHHGSQGEEAPGGLIGVHKARATFLPSRALLPTSNCRTCKSRPGNITKAPPAKDNSREKGTKTAEDFNQRELDMLWDYYLAVKVRKNEAIPGGMVL